MIFFLQPQLIYVLMWCIQNTNDAFPELPIKERINLNFPGLNVKQNVFLRKVARPRCGSVGAVTPNSSYGGTLVWCMVYGVSAHNWICSWPLVYISVAFLHAMRRLQTVQTGELLSYCILLNLPCGNGSSAFRAFAGTLEGHRWEYCWVAQGTCSGVRVAVAQLLSSLTAAS